MHQSRLRQSKIQKSFFRSVGNFLFFDVWTLPSVVTPSIWQLSQDLVAEGLLNKQSIILLEFKRALLNFWRFLISYVGGLFLYNYFLMANSAFLVLKYSCMFMVRIRSAKLLTMHSKLTFDILSVVVR